LNWEVEIPLQVGNPVAVGLVVALDVVDVEVGVLLGEDGKMLLATQDSNLGLRALFRS
jgi:hypothetical protein